MMVAMSQQDSTFTKRRCFVTPSKALAFALIFVFVCGPVSAQLCLGVEHSIGSEFRFNHSTCYMLGTEGNREVPPASRIAFNKSFQYQEEVINRKRLWMSHGLLASGILCYLIYGYYVFWTDAEYYRFSISDWNDTHQRSYAGGADKFSHAFGAYIITRSCSRLYRWAGMRKKKAIWLSFSFSQLFLLVGELEDGFTIKYGFDPVDLTSNIAGGLIGVCEETWPTFDKCFDFRMDYWPSREWRIKENFDNIAEDYSGQRFFFVFKTAGLLPTHSRNPLRYLELYAGFRTKGYRPGYSYSITNSQPGYQPYYKERELMIGCSLDVREIIYAILRKKNPEWGERKLPLVDFLFELYQHPLHLYEDISISRYTYYYPVEE